MRPVLIAIGSGIAGAGLLVGWMLWRVRDGGQYVKLTEKRHAEMLDLQRRQNDER